MSGIWTDAEIDGANNGYTLRFYDSDGSTVLTSVFFDEDVFFSPANIRPVYLKFPSSITVDADTFYRISFFPLDDASPTISIGFDEFDSVALMDGMVGGQNFHRSFQTDGGGWTEDTNARMRVSLHIDQVDVTPVTNLSINPVSGLGARSGGKQ